MTKTVVFCFQRFAPDWLNLLVPAGDPNYAARRATVRVDDPIPLDGFWGMSPHMASLQAPYQAGHLGFIAGCGWPLGTVFNRSHFSAQKLIALADIAGSAREGWPIRLLRRHVGSAPSNFHAMALQKARPSLISGAYTPAPVTLNNFDTFYHDAQFRDLATNGLVDLYAASAGPAVSTAGAQVLDAVKDMRNNGISGVPVVGQYPTNALGQGLKSAIKAIKGGLNPRFIAVESTDGWDTHVAQLNSHANNVPNFANALRAFYDDLVASDLLNDVTLITCTEFGRKAIENASGTDHGTGFSMLAMGAGIKGGQVHGTHPGLALDDLYLGEDVSVEHDFTSILGELFGKRMGLSAADLSYVFPFTAPNANWVNFVQ